MPWLFRQAQNDAVADCGTAEAGGVDVTRKHGAVRSATIIKFNQACAINMDLQPTIRRLQLELERVKTVIAQLEELQNRVTKPKSNRGRKSMGSEERQQVSERMRKYWASRLKAR